MAMELVWLGSTTGLTRFLPLAQTTPPGMLVPATVGSNPSAYFSQFGTLSPIGFALAVPLTLVSVPMYLITHQSGKPPGADTPLRSAMEAFNRPVAKGAL